MLFHILEVQGGCHPYNWNGFAFATPADVHLDIPYCEEQPAGHSSHSEESDRQDTHQERARAREDKLVIRPCGSSWFSPEAHWDMKKLKKEYHKLAKQYHPDRCKHPRSKQIFQETLNERAKILEHMN